MSEKRVSVRFGARGGGKVRAEFKGIGESGTREFERIGNQADATGRILTRVMGILGAAVSVRELVRYADTWTDLRSRVDLATGSQEAGAAVMDRLADMARRTYSSLEQTTESYLANSTALRELGMTTRESLDFTEALNNAIVVSGARQERAAQISNALSQAMALGALRGQQLNTVIMNGGRVAELLAAELGVGVNQLRQLGQQGVITGDVIRRALVGNLELLREEADSMPATIGDAFTLMGNAALELVGKWDEMLGASSAVADAIIFLADNLERVAAVGIAFAGVMAGRYVAGMIAAVVSTYNLVGALVALRAAIIRTGIGALIVGAGELIYWFSQLVRGAGGFGEALRLLGNVGKAIWQELGQGGRALLELLKAVAWGIAKAFTDAFKLIFDAWDTLINSMLTPFNALMDAVGSSFRLNAVSPIGQFLGRMSSNFERWGVDAAKRAGEIFQNMEATQAAIAEMVDAINGIDTDTDGALDGVVESLARVEDALNKAGGAAQGAGAANAKAAEEALQGWDAVTDSLAKYAAEAMDWGKGLGESLVSAFRGAEDAIVDFVTTGKADFKSLANSIIADLVRISVRRNILGPIANALSGALGGVGGIGGAALAPSFDRGGWTGNGARTGGLDGRGGFLAVMHPRERVIDETRPYAHPDMPHPQSRQKVHLSISLEAGLRADLRGDMEGIAVEYVRAGLDEFDRALPAKTAAIMNDPRRK